MGVRPSIGNVVHSTEAPDGKKRHGLFAPELAQARKTFLKIHLPAFALITISMFVLLSIYFGSYYRQIYRAPHLSVEVIDLDSAASPSGSVAHPAILGPAMRTSIISALQKDPHLGWYEADSETLQTLRLTPEGQGMDAFEYGMQKVLNQDVWAVIIVNANATSGVWAALTEGAMWEPTGAITFIWEEARNFYATDQYVERLNLELFGTATAMAGTELASQIFSLGNASAVLAAAPGGSVIGAFAYNSWNLRPFDQLAGIPATTVGTIYLIIFTFLISSSVNTLALPQILDKLTLPSELMIKVLLPWTAYLWLSLNYSIVSLAFEVNFRRKYGNIGFVLYWASNWVAMTGLGFVMETFFLLLGPRFAFFLLFWVIINVSVAFLDIADMQTFYRYGYILPVWNSVDAAKSIIFGTKNHLVQNFAVNVAWVVVGGIALASTVIYQRRKKEKGVMKKKWEEMVARDKEVRGESRPSENGG